MKKSIDMSLEELAQLDDEEARQAILNSKLNSSGSYLEVRFRDLQRHFGYPGLDIARSSGFEGDTTKATADLMMVMIEIASTIDTESQTYLKCIERDRFKTIADKRWKTQERKQKETLLSEAVELVRGQIEDGKHKDWKHSDYAQNLLNKDKFKPLNKDKGRKLRERISKLFQELNLHDRISGSHKQN